LVEVRGIKLQLTTRKIFGGEFLSTGIFGFVGDGAKVEFLPEQK